METDLPVVHPPDFIANGSSARRLISRVAYLVGLRKLGLERSH